jgi:hypothetical protein
MGSTRPSHHVEVTNLREGSDNIVYTFFSENLNCYVLLAEFECASLTPDPSTWRLSFLHRAYLGNLDLMWGTPSYLNPTNRGIRRGRYLHFNILHNLLSFILYEFIDTELMKTHFLICDDTLYIQGVSKPVCDISRGKSC